ncbi:uncharacterized protein [Zea mays]|uniref:uncharacterized protein isoform X2 n=1 Tax=Zea mays TaxID=4577 RepID=UPI0009AA2E16|nr:uncharacterized protein LOC109942972 isoform X2 [Zea mays]|eukprot:XP_020401175.1 uncharacterized protein LOC109942972 isoform X2 [Zea mays]
MFYAFLVTCEAANALSRKGCRHFEAFDQGNENFDREVFQAFRDKEILELAGLEGSLAILDDDVAERGVEVQSSRAVDGHADPSAAGTSRHSANEQVPMTDWGCRMHYTIDSPDSVCEQRRGLWFWLVVVG